jgi:hypothetical protein
VTIEIARFPVVTRIEKWRGLCPIRAHAQIGVETSYLGLLNAVPGQAYLTGSFKLLILDCEITFLVTNNQPDRQLLIINFEVSLKVYPTQISVYARGIVDIQA